MALTDAQCKNAKPKEKPYRLFDSGGLYLQVMPNGSKYWRYKYIYLKKEKLLAIGTYPFFSLKEAREKRDEAKKLLVSGIEPSTAIQEKRRKAVIDATKTFKVVALEWHNNQLERWSKTYAAEVLNRLEKDLFPELERDNVDAIDAPRLLEALRKVEKRGALDIARRLRQISGQVFLYGIQTGKCKNNPAADLTGALKTRTVKHFNAIEPNEIPELLDALEKNNARLFNRTRRAIKLSLFTFVRPTELREAVWAEINFEKSEWRIAAERMKSRVEHIVPLSKQALEVLKEQKEETGDWETQYVFPSTVKISEPMSDNTIRKALQNLGFKDRMTAHGFRALARTAIREELDYEPDIIEAQLAHKPSGALGAAYDRAKFLKKRVKMMQDWSNYIDRLIEENKKKVIHVNF
ncbi:tyrosine-type recombinase/integrase [Chryseobacterium mucoviscidosis]|uniref:tyrosine-type recombinase/integrase n=1 Tax=Chryseobacterium mucoviscidosis TaxID=1945581 RepID=UPI0031D72286